MVRIADAIASLDPLPDIVCLQEVETRSLRSTVAHRGKATQRRSSSGFMQVLAGALADAAQARRVRRVLLPGPQVQALRAHALLHHGARDPRPRRLRGRSPQRVDSARHHAPALARDPALQADAHLRARPLPAPDAAGRSGPSTFSTRTSAFRARSRGSSGPSRGGLGWGPNQVAEARNLARFVERERKDDRFVVVGDFNALPGSPVYRYLVEEHGWRDAFAERYRFNVDELARLADGGVPAAADAPRSRAVTGRWSALARLRRHTPFR